MAKCIHCSKSGFFLSVSSQGLCTDCNNRIVFDYQQKCRVITESVNICDKSKNIDTIISRMDLAIQLTNQLLSYDQYNLFECKFFKLLVELQNKKERYIVINLQLQYEEIAKKILTLNTVNAKVTQLNKYKLELDKYFYLLPTYQDQILKNADLIDQKIIHLRFTNLIEEAKKYQFKNNNKKALDKYYDALFLLKTDNIKDEIQLLEIKEVEDKIIELGGELN
jgi:hypothetical protein